MRQRVTSFFLALVCAVSALCLGMQPAEADDYIAANHTYSNGRPYYIMVDRVANVVTVYGLDESGYYTVPVRTMVCSVGLSGSRTPGGNFSVTGYRRPWLRMIDGSYGQYATQFYGNYLFHSVCYSRNNPSTLLTDEYNLLGSAASHGCVRLQTVDAKWIYDNCAAGTRVTIYDGSDPDPEGKPDTLVSRIEPEQDNGWDPTDPREENPWHSLLADPVEVEVTLREDKLLLAVGQMRALSASLSSDQADRSRIQWSSSDPAVATVSPRGVLTAQGEGNAVITAAYGDATASCTVGVRRVVLPFDDVDPDIWYYDDVCYAYENGILNGTGNGMFSPGMSMTYSMMAQVLCRMAGQDAAPEEGEPWYGPALRWAEEQQITAGLPQGFDPDQPIPRQDLVSMLYQYETVWLGRASNTISSLSAFSDREAVGESARDAMAWAIAHKLVQGTESGELLPAGYADRAQFSAILRRYLTQT